MHLHEGRHDIRSGPPKDEAGLRGLAGLRHILYVTRGEPELAHPNGLLQLKVPATSRLGDQQEIGEEEEVPLLRLHALKNVCRHLRLEL